MKWWNWKFDVLAVILDASIYKRVYDTKLSRTAEGLFQYQQCIFRLRFVVPHFWEWAAPLFAVIKEASENVGKRTGQAITELNLRVLG